jgi:hypothetical protein
MEIRRVPSVYHCVACPVNFLNNHKKLLIVSIYISVDHAFKPIMLIVSRDDGMISQNIYIESVNCVFCDTII